MTATAEQTQVVNGVDVQRLTDTIAAIQDKPGLAAFRFRATNQWQGGGHNRTTIGNFHGADQEHAHRVKFVYDNDEPDVLLGSDRGANPVEYLLHALAGCMTTSLVYHAAARGIHIERVESSFEGELDLRGFLGLSEDVPPGYRNIRASFRVKADATAQELEALFRYSPVCDTVCRPVQVEKQVRMLD